MSELDGKELIWRDQKMNVEIAERKAKIVLTAGVKDRYSGMAPNAEICVFKFEDEPSYKAIRWRVGAIIDLRTDDLAHAKAALDAMLQLEGHTNG